MNDSEESRTDWLSEIRKKNDDYLDTADYMYSEDKERMARVIREQSAILKRDSPWSFVGGDVVGGGYECRCCRAFIKTYLSPDGIDSTDFMERHKKDCIWRNLSDDAKELLK